MTHDPRHHDAVRFIADGGALIGMVHLPPLPGTPGDVGHSIDAIAQRAADDAEALADAGFDAIIIENMGDTPYIVGDAVGPEIVAAMTAAGRAVREAVDVPLGVQVLAGANRHALAVALAIGGSFIRAEGFAFAAVADEGLLALADAGPLLRYRRAIGAQHIAVFADVKKKHSSHALTADLDTAAFARGCDFMGADGLIITGTETGAPADLHDCDHVRRATHLPLLIGSGVNADTVADNLRAAHGVIVGSAIKHQGDWRNPVDPARAAQLVDAARATGADRP